MMSNRRTWIIAIAIAIGLGTASAAQDYPQVVQSLSAKLTESLRKSTKQSVAVVDFTDLQGNVTELGRFLAEEFSVALTSSGIQTIDRTHLKSILAEHKLATTGVIDPQTARQLGKLAGVDALVTGTLTPFGDSVRIVVKVLDVSTARVIDASTGELSRTKAIDELIAKSISAVSAESRTANPSRTGGTPGSDVQTGSADGFAVGLQWCRREERSRQGRGAAPSTNGGTVVCRLVVTNLREDRDLYYLGNGTRAFDESGQELAISEVVLANSRGGRSVSKTLISGVPTQATVSFDGVPRSSAMFAMLEIRADSFRDSIKFRNVPIQ